MLTVFGHQSESLQAVSQMEETNMRHYRKKADLRRLHAMLFQHQLMWEKPETINQSVVSRHCRGRGPVSGVYQGNSATTTCNTLTVNSRPHTHRMSCTRSGPQACDNDVSMQAHQLWQMSIFQGRWKWRRLWEGAEGVCGHAVPF